MALREMEQFNEIMSKIKYLVNWFKYNSYDSPYIRVFTSSGDSFNFKIQKDNIAHLLGINTSYLISTGSFKNTSSYELLVELCENDYRISTKIKDNYIKLSDIFSKHVYQKINCFKSNTNINLANTILVCKYNRNKAIYEGLEPRNCDYIVLKETDNNKILELDLIINNKYALPVSSRVYEKNDYENSLRNLLTNQDIAILSSIIVGKDDYDAKKIYLSEEQKLEKLKRLEEFREKFNCYIDVTGDFKYYCNRNKINRTIGKTNYNLYDSLIMSILYGNIIDTEQLDLTEQQLSLINAINDTIMSGTNNKSNKEKFSSLKEKIILLQNQNAKLKEENSDLHNQITQLIQEKHNLEQEAKKSKMLIKTVMSAIDTYKNPMN